MRLTPLLVDGKRLAKDFNVKYIETSPGIFLLNKRVKRVFYVFVFGAGINHNVDELLIGILFQLKLRRENVREKSSTKVSLTSLTRISVKLK